MSSTGRSAWEPISTILLTSAKWSATGWPAFWQAILAFSTTSSKLRHCA
jgi:hypothetical protein